MWHSHGATNVTFSSLIGIFHQQPKKVLVTSITKTASIFIALIISGCALYGQAVAIEPFPTTFLLSRKISLFQSYYNRFRIVADGVASQSLNLKAKGLQIIKEDDGLFYLRVIQPQQLDRFLRIYDDEKLIDSLPIRFITKIPLPSYSTVRRGDGHSAFYTLYFDSVMISFSFKNSLYGESIDYTYNYNELFTVTSMTVDIIKYGKVRYTEHIKGGKYTQSVKDKLREYGSFWIRPDSFAIGQLRVRDLKIQDDLGNTYTLPENSTNVIFR